MNADLESLLDPGERLLWSGSPSSERLLMRNDYLLIPGGIVLGIVGLVGMIIAFADQLGGDGSLIRLFGSLIALVLGWQGVIGHTIRRRKRALTTSYALTDARVIELRRGEHGDRARDQPLETAPQLRVRPQYEGRATIVVGAITLFNVEGATRVETLLRQQLPADQG